jgi:hypothetical protein
VTTPTELAGQGERHGHPPTIQDSTAGRRINLPDAAALSQRMGALPDKSTMGHAGRDDRWREAERNTRRRLVRPLRLRWRWNP